MSVVGLFGEIEPYSSGLLAAARARGITERDLREADVHAVNTPEDLDRYFPSWRSTDPWWVHGLPGGAFPFRTPGSAPNEITAFQFRPDVPIKSGDDEYKYLFQTGTGSILNTIRAVSTVTKLLILQEGTFQSLCVKVNTSSDVAIYGLAGCWNWRRGQMALPSLRVVKDMAVVLSFDADFKTKPQVFDAAQTLTDACLARGAKEVRYLIAPASGNRGIDDVLSVEETEDRAEFLHNLIAQSKTKIGKRPSSAAAKKAEAEEHVARLSADPERPLVVVNEDRFEVTNQISTTLVTKLSARTIYNHGGALSEFVMDEEDGQPKMKLIEKGRFKDLISENTRCVSRVGDNFVDGWPDQNTIDALLSRGKEYAPLISLTRTPFVRSDGSLCLTPGYDAATRTLLVLDPEMTKPGQLVVSDNPDDYTDGTLVRSAVTFLRWWLTDIFAKMPDEASKANYLALLLTPLTRCEYDITPLAVISGLAAEVGKGKSMDLYSWVTLGKDIDTLPWHTDDVENEKMLLAALKEGRDSLIFDEAHHLKGKSFARMLTSQRYSGRVLGGSILVSILNRVTAVAAGNQVKAEDTIERRTYPIYIKPKTEWRNRDVSTYTIEDIDGWTKANRGKLLSSLLTIIKGWHVAGKPLGHGDFSNFIGWQRVIGGVLANAGVEGFLDNRKSWRSSSSFEETHWAQHLLSVREFYGDAEYRLAELRQRMTTELTFERPPNFESGLDDPGYARRLGQVYAAQEGVPHGSLQLLSREGHASTKLWRVVPFGDTQAPEGTSGVVTDPGGGSLGGVRNTPVQNLDEVDTRRRTGVSAPVSEMTESYTVPEGQKVNPQEEGYVAPSGVTSKANVRNTLVPGEGQNGYLQEEGYVEATEVTEVTPPVPCTEKHSVLRRDVYTRGVGVTPTSVPSVPSETAKPQEEGYVTPSNTPLDPGTSAPPVTAGTTPGTAKPQEEGYVAPSASEMTESYTVLEGQKVNPQEEGYVAPPYEAVDLAAFTQEGTIDLPEGVLVFDIETEGKGIWPLSDTFIRISGWQEGKVIRVTADAAEMAERLRTAQMVVGANVLGFDLVAFAVHHGIDIEEMANEGRIIDTMLTEVLLDPPGQMPIDKLLKMYSLDVVAKRKVGSGKTDDLKALAKEYGGFDKIPVDETRYVHYLAGDVDVTAQVAATQESTPYIAREHRVAAITTSMRVRGIRVDVPLMKERADAARATRKVKIARLSDEYNIPLVNAKGVPFKAPHQSKVGKAAIDAAFDRHGIRLNRTEKTPDPCLKAEYLLEVQKAHAGNDAVYDLTQTLRELVGIRSVYETAETYTVVGRDGVARVHPEITMFQASGRWSTTKPGMTVFGKKNGKHVEREIFLPDHDDHVFWCADFSQLDARGVAAHCQDEAYLANFTRDRDLHTEVAISVFGEDANPTTPAGEKKTGEALAKAKELREFCKPITHGWNYGMQIPKLGIQCGDINIARRYDAAMRSNYPKLVAWKQYLADQADVGVILDNGYGRQLRCTPGRGLTQAPAMVGQGWTADTVKAAILRLPKDQRNATKLSVHDELGFSIPGDRVDEYRERIFDAMTMTWAPYPGAMAVDIVADGSKTASSWGGCYAD